MKKIRMVIWKRLKQMMIIMRILLTLKRESVERLVEANRNLSENTDGDIEDDNATEEVQTDVLLGEEHESKGLLDEVDAGFTTLLQFISLNDIAVCTQKKN